MRKAPTDHAKEFSLGYKKRGNDGNMWVVQIKRGSGIQRRVKKEDKSARGKNKPLEKSYPEPGKGIIFKKHPHYQVFPKKGARLVLVATFKQIK